MASDALGRLFLYASDCDPGCGCGAATFVEDPERVDLWIEDDGVDVARATLLEIERLASPPIDAHAVGLEVQYAFASADEARAFLLRWASLVRDAIARAEATPA